MDVSKLGTAAAEAAIKNSESLLSSLFGSRLKEYGERIADQIRYRRFVNQVEIFQKASRHLEEKGISAKPLALKYLVPLIDLSSLEEDPDIQNKWANIVANLASVDSLEIFNKNCIELLGKLSPDEVRIMDILYAEFIEKRGEVIEEREGKLVLNDYREIFSEDILFNPWEIAERMGIDNLRIKLYVENLVALGLLQFQEIELEDDELVKSFNVHITYLGLYFVRLCKF